MPERRNGLLDTTKPITERYQNCLEVLEDVRTSKKAGWEALEEWLEDLQEQLWEDMSPEQKTGFKSPDVAG